MIKALKRWLLANRIENTKREIEMYKVEVLTYQRNLEIMRLRLVRLEIEMIDVESLA